MKENTKQNFQLPVFVGDAIAILIAVLMGLRFHEANEALIARMLYNWLPWLLAWLAAGLPLGLFRGPGEFDSGFVGRILWGVLLASPLAAVLRSAWLGSAALPLFVLILGLVSALAVLMWRFVYKLWMMWG